jgi:gas vesicle protein GvpL/GvpF
VTGDLRYLYAVAAAKAEAAIVAASLHGIDGGGIEPIIEGDLLGVTSPVSSDYEEEPLNERLQDLDWLAPRAASHQEVNGKLLDLVDAVIPLAFGAIYRNTNGVRELLRNRADEFAERLRAVEGRAEWIVSIERERTDTPPTGGAVGALDAEIAAAPPGRAFLLGKRRDEVVRGERRTRDVAVAEETRATIEAIAERVYREPLIEDPTAAAIARFSVLARREREIELGDVVRRLGASGASEGYRMRLSGPWPAYRFGGLPSERVASG